MSERHLCAIFGHRAYLVLAEHCLPPRLRVTASLACFRVICLTIPAIVPGLHAEEFYIDFDQEKTRINFVLTDVLHTVHGNFRLKHGQISFNPARGAVRGEIVVDAASGNSGSLSRDKRMTRDVLEAQRYPEIRFDPTDCVGSVALRGTSAAEVTGSFLIHGETHKLTIPMQIQLAQEEVVATGRLIVSYVQWGMKSPSNFLLKVNYKVEIYLTIVGRIRPVSFRETLI